MWTGLNWFRIGSSGDFLDTEVNIQIPLDAYNFTDQLNEYQLLKVPTQWSFLLLFIYTYVPRTTGYFVMCVVYGRCLVEMSVPSDSCPYKRRAFKEATSRSFHIVSDWSELLWNSTLSNLRNSNCA